MEQRKAELSYGIPEAGLTPVELVCPQFAETVERHQG
jgi:hypothetical protein